MQCTGQPSAQVSTLSTLFQWAQARHACLQLVSLPDVAGRTALQVLRVLLKLLETSREPKTLAVGCHDLGSFITHYPAGKGLVTGASATSSIPVGPNGQVQTSTSQLQLGDPDGAASSHDAMLVVDGLCAAAALRRGLAALMRAPCPLACADLGGKDAVLRLVGHEDPAVQKQALLASQKVLLSKSKADYLTHLVRPPQMSKYHKLYPLD